jgi:predicted ATPase/DNA-binding SARP family transcriptional activator
MSGQLGSVLRIELLGGFRVAVGGAAVSEAAWRLRKSRALIKLLALTPEHSLHRERVIEALWPDRDHDGSSNNLRQAVFVARRALDSCGDDGAVRIAFANDVLALSTDRLQIDIEEFEAAAADAERAPSPERLRAAIGLYAGELLPEDTFEAWASARRESLRERNIALLLALAHALDESGDRGAAATALQQALIHEPLHERAHRELMRNYALTGRRQRALAQFHLLRESLRREFEDEPEEQTRLLYQEILTRRLGAEDGPERPPAATRAAPRRGGNLPLQLTSFVGRERELTEVIRLARRHRLLTLTGPGGCGKTRLGLEAAGAMFRDAADGVWLVELAGLSDGALVASAIGSVLGVESRSPRPTEQAVAAHIGERQMLIVLDNCEHLVGTCARAAQGLLTACPNLRILATSREPLHIPGEVDWRVPSLTPVEAEQLFSERASGVSSRFYLSDENADAVSEVCRRVDGIPLAIELAAARVGVLAPAQIAERLRNSLAVLAAGSRTALTRQQTLTATLDWSHERLDDDERQLFRRLGAFAGSFDLAAGEAVAGGELDVLGQLVDKSLVVAEEREGLARYHLLDTVRHYARGRMKEAGEREALEARHRAHYLALAEDLGPAMATSEDRRRLAREADELRWALRTALRSEPRVALRIAAALWRFWHDRGDRMEGSTWLREALTAMPEPSAARAEALHGLSVLALRIGVGDEALPTAREATAFFRAAGDRAALAEELHHLGTLAWVFADYEGAERWCRESQAVAEESPAPATVASVTHTLGVIAATRNAMPTGRGLIAHGIELLHQLPPDGDPLLLPVAYGYGRVPAVGPRRARVFLEHTYVTACRVRPAGAVAYCLCDLAAVTRQMGQTDAARLIAEESLSRFRALGDEAGAAQALAQLGNLHSAVGEHETALELHEESLAVREAVDDARGVGLSHLAASVAAASGAELDRARVSADRALEVFERTDDGPGRAAAVMQLGYLAADAGRPQEARELLEHAVAHWEAFARNTPWLPPILRELAELDAELGDPERAPRRLTQALAILTQTGDQAGVEHCRQLLRTATNGVLTPE